PSVRRLPWISCSGPALAAISAGTWSRATASISVTAMSNPGHEHRTADTHSLKRKHAMIENQPVLTIHRGHRRPGRTLIEAFRGAASSHLADAMNGRGSLDWRIKPLDPTHARFAGPALTAHSYPADIHGMVGAAMEAEAGDVICCANDGFTGTAVIGDLAAGILHNKDVAAFVT